MIVFNHRDAHIAKSFGDHIIYHPNILETKEVIINNHHARTIGEPGITQANCDESLAYLEGKGNVFMTVTLLT